jgi:hypothetical protein
MAGKSNNHTWSINRKKQEQWRQCGTVAIASTCCPKIRIVFPAETGLVFTPSTPEPLQRPAQYPSVHRPTSRKRWDKSVGVWSRPSNCIHCRSLDTPCPPYPSLVWCLSTRATLPSQRDHVIFTLVHPPRPLSINLPRTERQPKYDSAFQVPPLPAHLTSPHLTLHLSALLFSVYWKKNSYMKTKHYKLFNNAWGRKVHV